MIVVDTSIWIDFFKGNSLTLVQSIHTLLDEDKVALVSPVRLELLTGASKSDLKKILFSISALPQYYPTLETWGLVEKWIVVANQHGQKFAAMDMLIAAITSENNSQLWSHDRDFIRMEKMGFIQLYR